MFRYPVNNICKHNNTYKHNTTCKHNTRLIQRVFFILLIAVLCFSINAHAEHVTEYDRQLKVKVAFILNLVRFSQWEKSEQYRKKSTIELCLYQYNFLYDSLNDLTGKKLKHRKIQSKVIKQDRIIEPCDIILIPASGLERFMKFNTIDNLKNRITITDLTGEKINLKTLENKVIFRLIRNKLQLRFEVDTTAARKLNIGIGSELLKLGNIISEPDRTNP